MTSHHVIKLLALVTMTIDHIGAYLYPEQLWWRAIGRISFPVWFFLVGHALHYRPQRATFYWALILAGANPFLGEAFFPLNTLVTILVCQWLLMYVEKYDWLACYPWTLVAGAIVFLLPSFIGMEYGALGFLYALMGYAVRSGQMQWQHGKLITLVAFGAYLQSTILIYPFTVLQMLFVVIGILTVTVYLVQFKHRVVQMPQRAVPAMLLLSRHSMQYYVVHRIVLQLLGVLNGVLSTSWRWI